MKWNPQIPSSYRFECPWQEGAPPGQPGARFPRILQRPCSSADREDWLNRNKKFDSQTREISYYERPPNVGDLLPILATAETVSEGLATQVGAPLIAEDQEHESRLWQHVKSLEPEPVDIPIAAAKRRHRKHAA